MGGVLTTGKQVCPAAGYVPFNGLKLRGGAIRIIRTLEGQQGHADAGQVFADVKVDKPGMKPDPVPSEERVVCVGSMVSEQSLFQGA